MPRVVADESEMNRTSVDIVMYIAAFFFYLKYLYVAFRSVPPFFRLTTQINAPHTLESVFQSRYYIFHINQSIPARLYID